MPRNLVKNICFVKALVLIAAVSGCSNCGREPQAQEQPSLGIVAETESPVNPQTEILAGETKAESTGPKAERIKVTFVELGSVKCIPCKMMQPIMEEIEKEYEGQVKVVFYDVWTPQGQEYGREYEVRVIPTQVFLDKEGKEYFRHEGYFAKEKLVEVLKRQGVE